MNTVRLSRLAKPLALVSLTASLCLLAIPAYAGDKALAESLFKSGRELMTAGKYAEACPKFVESQKQDPSPGTLINLAQCYEGLGRSASAWAEYKEAATLARTMGRANQADFADQGAARLEPTLSKLRIDGPPTAVAGLVVLRDGADVGLGALGVSVAADPGEHLVEARAPGYQSFSTRVTLGAKGDAKVVQIPDLVAAPEQPAPAAVPAAAAASGAGTQANPASDQGSESGGSSATLGYVVGGAGVVALALGGTFALLAKGQADDAEGDPALCPNKQCSPEGRDEIDAASTKATIATIGFGVGIAGIGVGAYLILTAGSGEKSAKAPPVTPLLAHDGAGLAYRGEF